MKLPHYLLISLILISCGTKKEKPLFELAQDTGIDFQNNVVDGQLENSFYFRNYYNGGGVAIADINNDGLCDVLMTSNMGDNKLFLNKGNWKFDDISVSSGLHQDSMWSTGAVMADINHDGWLDIYICNSGHMKNGNRRNKLYINNHDLTFTESAAKYGLDIVAYSTQVSFFDYDLDGDLDCFLINNSPMSINNLGYTNRRELPEAQWPIADFLKGGGDHLYRNDNGHYKEVTKEAGIHGTLISFGLGVSVGDINQDGYPDVYVANDSYERDYLYINQKNGTFKDEMEDWIEQNSFSSMGADIADINNDGYADIFTTDMLPGDDYRLKTLGAFDNIDLYKKRIDVGLYRQFMKNCLFVNNGNGKFLESANFSNVAATDWSWGALFFDADNDGKSDIYVCNGINRDVTNLDFMDFFANDVVQGMVVSGHKQSVDSVLQHIPVYPLPNKVFRNDGGLHFTDIGKAWGMDQASSSNGAAYGDLDNDGDLDLVVNNENAPAFVYRNNSREQNGNSYLGVVLKAKGDNVFAIGSKIKVYAGGEVYYREVLPSRGFQSSMDYKQVIGLGSRTSVDSVLVIWPDGRYDRYDHPALNKVQLWEERGQQGMYHYGEKETNAPLLQEETTQMDRHQEDDYVDFYFERNLPEILSTEGPKVARGDVNGDGLQDVYVGGARGQSGQLYLQTPTGSWIKKTQDVFEEYKSFEDVAVLLFDADRDGDLDLFIGSGGNNERPNSRELQHRLYINDGKGNFTIDVRAFPNNDMNISVAVANDYDGDGDQDLFVGSRSMPYNYGITPTSYLYRNDGAGHFTEVTAQVAPGLAQAGMITGAVWSDMTGDGAKELVVVGEWMSPRTYQFDKNSGRFRELTTDLQELKGWWQTVGTADLNGDGKEDLVLGNIGENFYLHPSKETPVKLWLTDFDQNGTTEQFLTRTVDGRDVPVFLKREVTDQFPGLKKENLKHSDYAKKSMQELFPAALLSKAEQKLFDYPSSVIALSEGAGKFSVRPLNAEVQLSSVNAVEITDINADGKLDMVLAGNLFTFPPQFGRLDASYGHVLLGDGKGGLRELSPRKTGLLVKGNVRDIKRIATKNGDRLLFTINNEAPMLYRINDRHSLK